MSSTGPSMMFGLGGIFTEIYKDVQFCLLPAGPGEFERMIRGITGYPLLAGTRGKAPKDIEALIDVMQKLSKLVEDYPGFDQIDLNPVIVYEKGRLRGGLQDPAQVRTGCHCERAAVSMDRRGPIPTAVPLPFRGRGQG